MAESDSGIESCGAAAAVRSKWLKVTTNGSKWQRVTASGSKWLKVTTNGNSRAGSDGCGAELRLRALGYLYSRSLDMGTVTVVPVCALQRLQYSTVHVRVSDPKH
jgi:hypothetical protein